MPTPTDRFAAIWRRTQLLIDALAVESDPMRAGPAALCGAQSRVMTAWADLVRLVGPVARAHASIERAVLRERRVRKLRSDGMTSGAHNDPELRCIRDQPTRLKARICARLGDDDARIGRLEESAVELRALREYMAIVLDCARAAKEVLSQQAQILRDHRAAGRATDFTD